MRDEDFSEVMREIVPRLIVEATKGTKRPLDSTESTTA